MSEKDLRWVGWGQRLREHAKAKRISRETVAEKMGVSYAQVGHWYNGTRERECQIETFMQLCEVHGVDPSVILFGGPSVPADANPYIRQAVEILTKVRTPPERPEVHTIESGKKRVRRVK
jgi:transcriptional regulator with XRE-family HTH domain